MTTISSRTAEMVRLYNEGLSAEEIAQKFGISRQRVWMLIKDDPNYRARPRGGRTIPISQSDIREVKELLLEEDMTAKEAASELNLSTGHVRRIVRETFSKDEQRLYQRRVTGTRSSLTKEVFSDEDFIAALIKANSEVSGNLSTKKYANWRQNQVNPSDYPSEALFGQRKKWNEWKREAGLPVNERKNWIGIPKYTDHELMMALDRWVGHYGHDFISVAEAEAARSQNDPSISLFRIRYGSWMDTEAHYRAWRAENR